MAYASSATIRTVNNQSGSDADFTTVAAAISASAVGDTVYVQPSPTAYVSATLDKRIVLMGPGHNPTFSPYNSTINTLTIGAGADNAVVKGLVLASLQSTASITVNNLLFSGCQFVNYSASPISLSIGTFNNWVFEGDVFICGSVAANFGYVGSNTVIRNCYFHTNSATFTLTNVSSGTVVDHCIINTFNTNNYYGSLVGNNVEIKNSVLITTAQNNYGANYNCGTCNFHNNIYWNYAYSFPSGAGSNLNNTNPLFTTYAVSSAYDYNWDFHVGAESPAIGAASDGTNIGIYGGIFNFSHAGIDGGTPNVVDFTLGSSTAPAGGTITIHLNATGSGQ